MQETDSNSVIKEEQLLEKRLLELSAISFHKDIAVFSDFLSLNELNILHTIPKGDLGNPYITFGGYDEAERQMAAFYHDALCFVKDEFPISIVNVKPIDRRFTKQPNHRDYLGAVMNLGIDRSKVGDIFVGDNEACIFVATPLLEFICDNLTNVSNTLVYIEADSTSGFEYKPKYSEVKGTVASLRIDCVLSLALNISRNQIVGLIKGGRVFVNSREITSNSFSIQDDDIVSIRGIGKFQYKGVISKTRKNRFLVVIHKYV